jgi:hypothetical protein
MVAMGKKEKKNGKLKTKQIINTQHKSNQTTQIKSSEIKNNVTRTAFCDRREIWHIYTSFLQSNNSLSLNSFLKPLGKNAKFYRKNLLKVLYTICTFHPNWTKNMVAMGKSCF